MESRAQIVIRFWMVIRHDGFGSDRTSFRHSTYQAACAEAYRLSRLHKAAFVVLEAQTVIPAPEPEWKAVAVPVMPAVLRSDMAVSRCDGDPDF